ncbi:hypothetical protein [Paenibacillus rigui]|uniref:hypothetical protein n=1 Tax=Paenibacillus rigui TaxID=554312 RepID=UPI0015C60417|nr:hypothetical protein [Paenibacillus rigui]
MRQPQWRQEIIYVKRDKNGVIIAMEEEMPEGFIEEDEPQNISEEELADVESSIEK